MPLLWHDAQLFALPLVTLVLTFRIALPARHPGHIALDTPVKLSLALLFAVLALLPLVKGTLLLASGAALVLGCAILVLGGAAVPAVAGVAIFVAAMPLFWVLSPQPLSALPGFFIAQLPIIAGYTGAMALHGPAWQILLYICCCLIFALAYWRQLAAAGRTGKILLAGIALMLFLGFKEGFVRDDQHSVTAAEMLIVAGWSGLLLGRQSFASWLALLIGLGCSATTILPEYGSTFVMSVEDLLAPYFFFVPGLETRLFDPQHLRRAYAASLAAIRAQSPLPALAGPTDIYSYGQSALLAAPLDWDPRPVLQTYSAYTPSLLRADAAHLAGPAAPENIIFAVQPFDGRLAPLEDGASWPWLLTRYQFAGFSNVHIDNVNFSSVILRRRPAPGRFVLTPVTAGMFKLDARVPLPSGPGLIWAELTLKPSFAGMVLSFLFKPPMLSLVYDMPGGSSIAYRYIAGMGASGFLLAPMVSTSQDFAGLYAAQPGGALSLPAPVGFRITVMPGFRWAWQKAFKLHLYTLQMQAG